VINLEGWRGTLSTAVIKKRPMVECLTNNEIKRIWKYVAVPIPNFPAVTENNHVKHESEYPTSLTRFKPSTFRIQI
jgi:hypothetical protein